MAANTKRKGGSAIDGRTTRHESYSISQRIREKIEEIFGWMKTVGGFKENALSRDPQNAVGGLVGGSGVQPRAHGENGGLSAGQRGPKQCLRS